MIDYIKGEITDLSPTFVVVEANGIGYFVHISLPSYSELLTRQSAKLYIYEAMREDACTLYGFLTQNERTLFLYLISVSGVGANTARMILSSLSPAELQQAILSENVALLKNVKGIGLKTAQRIILDLKDKVIRTDVGADTPLTDHSVKAEAVSALVMLGFQQSGVLKVVEKLYGQNPALTVEQLIKQALQQL
ncbi:MAG: Holliday junction branch migration protein RuvA [Prevotellaceae bacterium]|jgi:Holliday junction DNA helicase RuvA|nr:Holliday junction branch migration protein RuvA [Prevotellaceae bacterium]